MPELKLNAKQLRVSKPGSQDLDKVRRLPIAIVLDNIQDTFNIGSFFRLADAVAAEKLYLCGESVTPPNIKIHRASIGTWRWVPWEHHLSTSGLVDQLKKKGYFLVAAELTSKSIFYHKVKPKTPIALVVGNETAGVSKEVLKKVDRVVKIPMLGVNKSLNVLASASAILYHWVNLIEPHG
ncbi:MAG: TrmH family RNA methyltransferase [Patescibacteria group bacterium]|nr:TrmH family RNA methyltransferase [Patescibacteria group bacterium]